MFRTLHWVTAVTGHFYEKREEMLKKIDTAVALNQTFCKLKEKIVEPPTVRMPVY